MNNNACCRIRIVLSDTAHLCDVDISLHDIEQSFSEESVVCAWHYIQEQGRERQR